ncbi:MAG: GH3 auxin-responsive promoter family protein [Mogibacterium sp.]|nr:GH3 auxin-responsive promoter family protein [Mogibacterium sp.]
MNKRDIYTKIIVGAMIKKGHMDLRSMHKNAVDARKKNEALLFEILKRNKDTEYGRLHGFSEIKTLDDFQKKVPVTNYHDYEDYIERMINNGEENLITALPVVGYAQSSGTVGGRKYVPLTQQQVDVYTKHTVTRMMACADNYMRKYHGRRLKPGRGLYTNHAIFDYLPNGVLSSNVADVAARQLGFLYPYILSNPYKRLFTQHEAEFRYVNTRFALQDRDTMYVFSVFLKMFTDLMLYLEKHWETIVDDIEKGTVSDLAKATPEVMEMLKAKIKPDPERAAELRREFEKGFDETIIPRIWPNMSVICGIGTSTFEQFYKLSKSMTGDIPYDFSIYGASEGLFAAVDELNSPKQLMLVESCFYEFVPVEDESKVLCIDELEIGQKYEIIVTTQSGLYRYKCGDVITVVDYLDECPYIQFAYRKGQLLNLAGEKTTEEHMQAAVDAIANKAGCKILNWTVDSVIKAQPCHYLLMLENDKGMDLREYTDFADEVLREINVRYAHFNDRGVLGKVEIANLEPGSNAKWISIKEDAGTSVSQIKPVRILDTDEKKEFFSSRLIRK